MAQRGLNDRLMTRFELFVVGAGFSKSGLLATLSLRISLLKRVFLVKSFYIVESTCLPPHVTPLSNDSNEPNLIKGVACLLKVFSWFAVWSVEPSRGFARPPASNSAIDTLGFVKFERAI